MTPGDIYGDLVRSCRHVSPSIAAAASHCLLLSILFVAGLYLVVPRDVRRLSRDDPRQIKWRIVAVAFVTVASTLLYPLTFCDDDDNVDDEEEDTTPPESALRYMGWTWNFDRDAKALLHVAALYLGPIVARLAVLHVSRTHVVGEYSCVPRRRPREKKDEDPPRRRRGFGGGRMRRGGSDDDDDDDDDDGFAPHNIGYGGALNETVLRPLIRFVRCADESERWGKIRDVLVAPAAEEIVFRGCMVSPWLESDARSRPRPSAVAWIVPLFFGAAHLHHAIAKLHEGRHRTKHVIVGTAFQFAYTSLFGAYAAHALMRTGSVPAVVLCHSFCNCMGLPDLGFWRKSGTTSALSCAHRYRYVIAGAYAIGIAIFASGFSCPPPAHDDADGGGIPSFRWCFFPETSALPSL